MTVLARTSFGFDRTATQSTWFGDSVVQAEKRRNLERHLGLLRDQVAEGTLVEKFTTRLAETGGGDFGREYAWITEVA